MDGGHIRERNGAYKVIIELGRDPKTGKRKQKWLGTYKTKREANKALIDALAKKNANDFILPTKVTVKEFLELWCEKYAKTLSPTTYVGYKGIIDNHLVPSLGRLELQKLKPAHIEDYYNSKSNELKGKTLLQHHRILRKAMDYAWKNQYITKNPVDMVNAPKVTKYKSEVLTPIDVKRLLNLVAETHFKIPVNLAIGLGLRLGEILGLRWEDVDFINDTISINQTLVRAGTELIFKDPKTDLSKRTLSVPKELMNILKNHETEQKKLVIKDATSSTNDKDFFNSHNLVCTNSSGGPLNTSTFSHAFGDFIKKNDFPHIRFHDLRHTNATLMLLAGTPAKVASDRLGHSTIHITMDLYSHVLTDMNEDAANKLNSVIYK